MSETSVSDSNDTTLPHTQLPTEPPLDTEILTVPPDPSEHAAVPPPPDLPPTRHSRWWMVGGVLGLVLISGLVGWAIGRRDSDAVVASDALAEATDPAEADQPNPTDRPDPGNRPDPADRPDPGDRPGQGDPQSLEDLLPPGVLEAIPDDVLDQLNEFLDAIPNGATERFFSDPERFFDRFGDQFGADLEEFFNNGGLDDLFGGDSPFGDGLGSLDGQFGRLDRQLESLGLPVIASILPDGAEIRGINFSSGRDNGDITELVLTVEFELDGSTSELSFDGQASLPDSGDEVNIDGGAGRLSDGEVVWESAVGVTTSLRSDDLDQDALIQLATDIESALR